MTDLPLFKPAVKLLSELIATQSFSREEDKSANLIETWLQANEIKTERRENNVWAVNRHFDPEKPTILLNSHHDTVRPNKAYTKNPFYPELTDGKLYGLGSNDAGGALVGLMVSFVEQYEKPDLNYNLILAATAEEEISGENGIALLLPFLPKIDFAIVGEPTGMNMAIAEKGLMVIDGVATGVAGHAAHENTKNAIYVAIDDITRIREFEFGKISETLGKVKASVTQIKAGTQHNVVPDVCTFVIDVRITDAYSNQEVLETLNNITASELVPRSMRLNSSGIPADHPIVQAGTKLGLSTYGSPTLSDQALMPFPSLKMGPGQSERSHSADEYITLEELTLGFTFYNKILNEIL